MLKMVNFAFILSFVVLKNIDDNLKTYHSEFPQVHNSFPLLDRKKVVKQKMIDFLCSTISLLMIFFLSPFFEELLIKNIIVLFFGHHSGWKWFIALNCSSSISFELISIFSIHLLDFCLHIVWNLFYNDLWILQFRGSKPVTDLKKVKSSQEVSDTLSLFLGNREDIRQRLATRLAEIRTKLEQSHYFRTHEVRSLLLSVVKSHPAYPKIVIAKLIVCTLGSRKQYINYIRRR